MKLLIIISAVIVTAVIVTWTGLQFQPRPFPIHPEAAPVLENIPLPNGLPAPVERFYRTVYGNEIPVIETAVIKGRAVIRPFMDIPMPARFVFIHQAGRAYRHYIEATFFGIPVLKVNEGYVEGQSFFESPMGSYYDDPNTNQGANLALWAEGIWFPSIWITDPRVHWEAVADHTARLIVPFEEHFEEFVVRFNPSTGLIDSMEAMRYRDPGEAEPKILWITRNESENYISGSRISAIASAAWADQDGPWAVFMLEELVYNVDVGRYIGARGP